MDYNNYKRQRMHYSIESGTSAQGPDDTQFRALFLIRTCDEINENETASKIIFNTIVQRYSRVHVNAQWFEACHYQMDSRPVGVPLRGVISKCICTQEISKGTGR